MKILAIDTSTEYLCMALFSDGKIYEYNLEVSRKLSSLLHTGIDRALRALSWQIKDIDYFACGIGPGSFTGMRVGLAAMKGLSWALHKPLIGISTLDILAQNLIDRDGIVVAIIDARRKLIYCSIYYMKNRKLRRSSPYMLLNERELLKKIKSNSIIIGNGLNLYRQAILKSAENLTLLSSDYWYPKAGNIIRLALERIRDRKFDDPYKLVPIYLYPKECQIREQ